MEVSQNLISAITHKRKLENARHENTLVALTEQHKKALSVWEKNQTAFVNMTMMKRNEWWKKDKSIRDSLRKRLDVHLKTAEAKKLEPDDDEDKANIDVIASENHLIILDEPIQPPQPEPRILQLK
jgi:hypothetical protein